MTKNELKGILHLNTIINSKLRQLEEIKKYEYTLSAVSYEDVFSKGNNISDPTGNAAIKTTDKIIELNSSIVEDIDNLISLKTNARNKFNQLDIKLRTVMELRYLECRSWENVAEEMNYSIDNVYKLHGVALQKIQKKGEKN
jgi:DNA-directed RNA polymerase specialized sigma subunit